MQWDDDDRHIPEGQRTGGTDDTAQLPGARGRPPMSGQDSLGRLSSSELHDMALHRARRHLDVKFFWNLVQLLPTAEASAGHLDEAETNVLRLSAHIDDVTQAGNGPVADALRPYYLEYLARHGITAP